MDELEPKLGPRKPRFVSDCPHRPCVHTRKSCAARWRGARARQGGRGRQTHVASRGVARASAGCPSSRSAQKLEACFWEPPHTVGLGELRAECV